MNLLAVILGYAAAAVCVAGVIAFAALGFPYAAIGSGCTAVWLAFVAAAEGRRQSNDREWREAMKHPRL